MYNRFIIDINPNNTAKFGPAINSLANLVITMNHYNVYIYIYIYICVCVCVCVCVFSLTRWLLVLLLFNAEVSSLRMKNCSLAQ